MPGYLKWFELHSHTSLLIGLSILGLGVLASLLGRSRRGTNVPAQDRSVRVGRDNTGPIITGDLGQTANPDADLLNKLGSWASIIGLLIAVISTILQIHSWLQGSVK